MTSQAESLISLRITKYQIFCKSSILLDSLGHRRQTGASIHRGRLSVEHVLLITTTIFLIISVGYICFASSLFDKAALEPLGQFVVTIALPALIFRTLTTQSFSDIANFGYLGGYLFGSMLVLGAGYLVAGIVSRNNPVHRTFDAAGMACANSGLIGYPILLLAMPAVAPTALAMNMLTENLIMIPLVIILADVASGRGGGSAVKVAILSRVLKNPLVLAMVASLVIVLLDLTLPGPVSRAIDLVASSSVAISLFVIGGMVAGVSIRKIGPRVPMIVLGKLFALPLAVWLGFSVMSLIGFGLVDPELRKAAIIMAATPTMSIYPLLAQRYGDAETAATAMLIMTVLSFFTISALLYLL